MGGRRLGGRGRGGGFAFCFGPCRQAGARPPPVEVKKFALLSRPPPPPSPPPPQVVLDLDETLIAAYPEPAPRVPLGRRRASPTVVVRDVDLGDGASGPVRVFLRPGLATFLDEVAAFADVVLFTAGLSGYAAPLLAALDPTGARLPVRLYRPSTRTIAGTPCVKDLSVLGRDLARVVLVDNSPFSFLAQPACGVPAAPFDGCGDDAHLLDAVLPLLRSLASVDDVRPALAARFGMAAWLAARGGWALYEAPCGNLALAGETGGGAVPAAA